MKKSEKKIVFFFFDILCVIFLTLFGFWAIGIRFWVEKIGAWREERNLRNPLIRLICGSDKKSQPSPVI